MTQFRYFLKSVLRNISLLRCYRGKSGRPVGNWVLFGNAGYCKFLLKRFLNVSWNFIVHISRHIIWKASLYAEGLGFFVAVACFKLLDVHSIVNATAIAPNNFPHVILVSISDTCLNQLLYWCLENSDFSNHYYFYIYQLTFFPFPPYLFFVIVMGIWL